MEFYDSHKKNYQHFDHQYFQKYSVEYAHLPTIPEFKGKELQEFCEECYMNSMNGEMARKNQDNFIYLGSVDPLQVLLNVFEFINKNEIMSNILPHHIR